jgi:hypothetical protein
MSPSFARNPTLLSIRTEQGPSRHAKPKNLSRSGGIRQTASLLRLVLLVLSVLSGCGAPGEPVAPSPQIPTPVTDLAAHQAGDGVQLIFTLPSKTITGDKLSEAPSIEIFRGALKPDGAPDNKSFRVVYTIPGTMLDNYLAEGRVRFIDPVPSEDLRAHPGATFVYRVRTRASRKRASADSNTVTSRVFPVHQRIDSLQAHVTESAIELSWSAPARTSAGDPVSEISGYHVYRGELDPTSADAASKDLSQAKWIAPLTLLAPTPENSYRDTSFEFGKTYLYSVRTVIIAENNPLESSDSIAAVVTPRDIFPPAAPQDLVAAVFPGASPGSLQVDLSWPINLENDLAGYRIYRSEQQGARGKLLTSDLLPTPAYRDTTVEPGHRYWYSVTAVDRAGNESSPSAPVDIGVTQPPS